MHNAVNALPRLLRDRRTMLLILAAVAIVVVACRGSGSNPSAADQGLPFVNATTSAAQCVNHVQPEGAPTFDQLDLSLLETQEAGLRFYDIEKGTGDTPSIVDAVSVEYTGWLENGCMFDTSYPNEGPVNFPLLNVILGWQRGFSTMQEGGTRVLEIGPDLGYRAIGFPPRIPGNATLIFQVTLINRVTIAEAEATLEAVVAEATVEAAQTAEAEAASSSGDDATVTPTP